MVCWNDSIARSVELGGSELVFMGLWKSRLLFRSGMERGIGDPVPTAFASRCADGSPAAVLVLDEVPLAMVFFA